jgi:hypothetical protein
MEVDVQNSITRFLSGSIGLVGVTSLGSAAARSVAENTHVPPKETSSSGGCAKPNIPSRLRFSFAAHIPDEGLAALTHVLDTDNLRASVPQAP